MAAPPRQPARRLPRRTVPIGLGLIALLAMVAGVVVATRGPKAIGGATRAEVRWEIPRTITEEQAFALRLSGGVDGHAAIRTALRTAGNASACPADPPDDAARRVLLDRKDDEQQLGRAITDTQRFTAASSGEARICGWLLATSPAGDGKVLSRLDRALPVRPAAATLTVSRRTRVRAGARFALRSESVTSGEGRRLLLLAVPEAPPGASSPAAPQPSQADRCRDLRPTRRSPQRPLRIEVPVEDGAAKARLRVRFPFLAVGTWVLCTQIREADDPEPEAVDTQVLVVKESRECVAAKAAIADRRDDLRLIRHRREVLEGRIRESRRELRAASGSREAAKRRQRATTDAARLRSYQTGTKAISQLIDRVTAGARTYCPDL